MDSWKYDSAADLDSGPVDRLKRFPREPDMLVYAGRLALAAVVRVWFRLYHRFTVVGREHLPADGSFVLVANHSSHLDALSLISALPIRELHRVFPAAAADYFFVSTARTIFSAIVVNALPFDREVEKRQSLSLCKRLLENPGNVLVIFPEGTRSTTAEVREFKIGVGLILAGTTVPVLPCYLQGAHQAWPKGAALPRPGSVRLSIGQSRRYPDLPPGKESAELICRELREAVLALMTAAGSSPNSTHQEST